MFRTLELFGEGSKVNQIFCAFLINIPALGYGMTMGWMSPMSLLLQSEDSPTGVPLTDIEVSWMAAIAFLICIPATFIMAWLGDWMGRKNSLLLGSCISAIVWILLLCFLKVWVLILARVLVGIVMANCYVICTVYTKEISEDCIRGALGCMVSLLITMGNLSLYIFGDLLHYNTILWICLSVPLFHLAVFIFMPDSPSFLMKRGKRNEASKALSWLRCRKEEDPLIQSELNQIQKELDDVKVDNKLVLKKILSNGTLSKAFSISILVTVACDLCGVVTVLNFAGEIFTKASNGSKFYLNANQQAMVLGAVQVAGAMLASTVVEKAGRKPLLIFSSILSGITIGMLATWFLVLEYGIVGPSWIPISTLCLSIFSDAAGLKPIALVVANEIFSYEYRGTVMAVAVSIACATDFLQLLFFKPLANLIGIYMGFYLFAAVCIVTAVYVIIVVPETKSRTLEEIYADLNLGQKNCAV